MGNFQPSGEQPGEGRTSKGLPVWVWILSGCGCITAVGVFGVPILLAIALSFWVNQVDHHADQLEANEGKTYVGSLNRSQQAYFLENEQFSDSVAALDLGIAEEIAAHQLQVTLLNELAVRNVASPKDSSGTTYAGFVWIVALDDGSSFSMAQVCEGPYSPEPPPRIELPPLPAMADAPFPCPAGFTLSD